MRRGASESAARPPTSASTGWPAASALVSVGDAKGSTPTTLMRPAYHAAIPAISLRLQQPPAEFRHPLPVLQRGGLEWPAQARSHAGQRRARPWHQIAPPMHG